MTSITLHLIGKRAEHPFANLWALDDTGRSWSAISRMGTGWCATTAPMQRWQRQPPSKSPRWQDGTEPILTFDYDPEQREALWKAWYAKQTASRNDHMIRAEIVRRYNNSDKGRAARARYASSPKGQAARRAANARRPHESD